MELTYFTFAWHVCDFDIVILFKLWWLARAIDFLLAFLAPRLTGLHYFWALVAILIVWPTYGRKCRLLSSEYLLFRITESFNFSPHEHSIRNSDDSTRSIPHSQVCWGFKQLWGVKSEKLKESQNQSSLAHTSAAFSPSSEMRLITFIELCLHTLWAMQMLDTAEDHVESRDNLKYCLSTLSFLYSKQLGCIAHYATYSSTLTSSSAFVFAKDTALLKVIDAESFPPHIQSV